MIFVAKMVNWGKNNPTKKSNINPNIQILSESCIHIDDVCVFVYTVFYIITVYSLWIMYIVCSRKTYVYQGHSVTGSLRLAPVSPEQGIKWMSFLGLKPTFFRNGTSFSLHSSYLCEGEEKMGIIY